MKLYVLTLAVVLASALGYRLYKDRAANNVLADKVIELPIIDKLLVTPKINKQCQAGEIDYIKKVTRITDNLLISFEAIPGSRSFQPLVKKISVIDLFQTNVNVFLTENINLKLNYDLALMVCTDKSKSGKCLGKKIFDFNAANIDIARGQSIAQKNDDSIFYFQYLTIREGKLAILDLDNISPEAYPGHLSEMVKDPSKSEKLQSHIETYINDRILNLGSRGVGVQTDNQSYQILARFNQLDPDCDPTAGSEDFYKIYKENPYSNKKRRQKWEILPKFSRQ